MRWTRFSRSDILECQKRYKTDVAIGKALGVSKELIWEARCRFEIPSTRKLNAKRNERIRDLYMKGMPVAEISKKVGLTYPAIRYILFKGRMKVPKRKIIPKKPKISKSEFIRLQKKFGTDRAIGEELGVSTQRIQAIRSSYGLPRAKTEAIKSLRAKNSPRP